MTHTASLARPIAIEPQRIAATSTVLALHALALGLLLAPISRVNLPTADPPRTQVQWQTVAPVLPPPAPPAPQFEKTRPSRLPVPALPSFPVLVDQVDVADVSRLASALASTPEAVDSVAVDLPAQPVAAEVSEGSSLRMLHAPPPAYPAMALRQRAQGEVMLRVLVGSDGKPLQVEVERSSGRRDLDQAARQQVLRRWRFAAPVIQGQPVQAWGRVPIAFTLQD